MREPVIYYYNELYDNENTVGMSPEQILIACEEHDDDDLSDDEIEAISMLLAT